MNVNYHPGEEKKKKKCVIIKQGQVGWVCRQPGLVLDMEVGGRGVETWWFLESPSTQAILWFYLPQGKQNLKTPDKEFHVQNTDKCSCF